MKGVLNDGAHSFIYTDAIILMADSLEGKQCLIDRATSVSEIYGIRLNSEK